MTPCLLGEQQKEKRGTGKREKQVRQVKTYPEIFAVFVT
jgi:hypothetical protein